MSPGFGNFETGRFNLTPQEREVLEREGRLKETEERVKDANEALRKKAGEKVREDLKKDFEKKAA